MRARQRPVIQHSCSIHQTHLCILSRTVRHSDPSRTTDIEINVITAHAAPANDAKLGRLVQLKLFGFTDAQHCSMEMSTTCSGLTGYSRMASDRARQSASVNPSTPGRKTCLNRLEASASAVG